MEPSANAGQPGRTSRACRALRFAERICLILGTLLLAAYSGAMLDRTAGSRMDVREFAAQLPPNKNTDLRLPSEEPIRQFRQSLSIVKSPPMAVLSIGHLGIQAPVFQGTTEVVLNRGLGWIEGTARPGAEGNSGIAGHRDGLFRALKDVAVGDVVELNTGTARLAYRVEELRIVAPEDVWVLAPRNGPSLTLVTCYPFHFVGDAPQRFIVHTKLDRASLSSPSVN